MKQSISTAYVFNAAARTVDLSSISGFSLNKLYAIINVTRNQIIYAAGTSYGINSITGAVLTLQYNTSSMSNSDSLAIYYDVDSSQVSVTSTALPTNAAQESGGHLASIDSKLKDDGSGNLLVNLAAGSISLGTASDGVVGSAIPSEASLLGLKDPSGNLQAAKISAAGNLLVESSAQTNGSQKSQVVDGSGNVITSTSRVGKQGLDVTLGSAATPGSVAPNWTDVFGGVDPSGNAQQIQLDASKNLKVTLPSSQIASLASFADTLWLDAAMVYFVFRDTGSGAFGTFRIDTGASYTPVGDYYPATIADFQTSGSITTQNLVPAGAATAGSAVTLDISGKGTVTIQVTGTYTGALSPQVTTNNSAWITQTSATLQNMNTGAYSTTIPSGANGIWQIEVNGHAQFRITALAAVTGSASITLRASAGTSQVSVVGGATSALQTTGNNYLATIATNTGAQATDFTSTGTIAALNGTVSVTGQGVYTVSASVTGTWVGTLIFEGQTSDNLWQQLPFYQVSVNTPFPTLKSTFSNGTYLVTGGGYLNIRVRASSWTSGTASVALDGSLSQQTIYAAQLGNTGNTRAKFREEGVSYSAGANWTEVTKTGGALIIADGNTAGANYLTLSLDPTQSNSAIQLEAPVSSNLPIELIAGLSMSQRTIGQEFAVEIVDTGTAVTYTDIAISSIQQAATILTVNTATAHGLRIGDQISIYGVNDPRVNYTAAVVASVPSTTQFTVTAGPVGTITSITAGPFTSGFVSRRNMMGGNSNGVSLVFDNAAATNAAFFVKAGEGNVLPVGAIAGQQVITLATTASVQAVNSAYAYAFQPSTEFHLVVEPGKAQLLDTPVDNLGGLTSRAFRSQLVPSTDLSYKLRFRAQNLKGMTMPIAQIVSATKTNTTTATIVTSTAHGLTTADLVNIYGLRDQTNFANLTAATAVASVIDSFTFTVVIGTAVTATTYGGYVARIYGNFLMSSNGAVAQVVQTATLASGILTLAGNAAWAGLSIGDYINLISIRESTVSGASLGVDGAYRVRNIATTSLELERIDGVSMPADFATTNCGGAVIKRTDLRIHYAKLFDYDRQRVEMLPRAYNDVVNSISANITNTPAVTISSGTVTAVSTVTSLAQVATIPANSYIFDTMHGAWSTVTRGRIT